MPLPTTLRVCIAGVFCCSLLALHLLWLATLNRRHRPTVVGGERDFAATLAGLAGFFLVGAAIPAAIGPAWLAALPAGSMEGTWSRVAAEPLVRWLSLTLYGAVLAAAAAVGFWNRRDTLEVHNIDPAGVPVAVECAAATVGLGASGAVDVRLRPSVGHATVRVHRLDPTAVGELLAALTRRLADAPAPARSAGGWYTAAACGLLGCTVTFFAVFFRLSRMI